MLTLIRSLTLLLLFLGLAFCTYFLLSESSGEAFGVLLITVCAMGLGISILLGQEKNELLLKEVLHELRVANAPEED